MAKMTAAQLSHYRWVRERNRRKAMKKAMAQMFDGKNLNEVRVVLKDMLNACGFLWKDGFTFYWANNPSLKFYL